MMLFQLLWLFNSLLVMTAAGLFIRYLFKGPISASISGTWILLLGGLIITMLGAGWMKMCNHDAGAILLLSIMASPGCIFILLLIGKKISHYKSRYHAKIIYDDFL